MRHRLRDYQQVAVDFTLDFLRAAGPGEKRLLAAPTGSGKSLISPPPWSGSAPAPSW